MRLITWSVAIVIVYGLVWNVVAEVDESAKADVTIVPSARSRFVMPKLFDFPRFMEMFNKNYPSIMEQLVAKKMYLARAFASFISMVNYVRGQLSSYQSVNPMSDMTPAQRDKLKISQENMESQLMAELELADNQEKLVDEKQEMEQLELAISQVEQNKQEPGYKELAKELDRLSGDLPEGELGRNKRSISFGGTLMGALGNVNGGIKSMLDNAVAALQGPNPVANVVADEPRDIIYADHRRSGCILSPRSQGNCGSCSVFSATALFEYLYCRLTGRKEAFSEQYVMDCMEKFKCSGNYINLTFDFVKYHGFELRSDYPYRKINETCPYPNSIGLEQRGYIRFRTGSYSSLRKDKIRDYIRKRPVVYAIRIGPKFRDYGGGVDPNDECAADDNHAMLIVGHGREDGKDYFLFKNSHSVYWGEGGYYKMEAEALQRCGHSFGYVSDGRFEGDGINQNYVGAKLLRKRYRSHHPEIR